MGRSLRGLHRAIVWILCIGLLLFGIKESGAKAAPTTMGSLKGLQGSSRDMEPFLTSKRRVPNGPDPIHNRRAGKSGRPPGRA